jgi:heme exporter protein B
MVVNTRFAELLLPLLALPFLMPPITGAVQMTARLFAGRPVSELAGWFRLLLAYDVVFLVVTILVFESTLEE